MKKYFLQNGNEQHGPFDISDLKAKNINSNTLIWCEGIPDWIAAGEIEELKILFKQITPPPIKVKSAGLKAENKRKSAAKKITKNLVPLLLIFGAVIFSVIAVVAYSNRDSNPASYAEKKMSIEEIENSDPIRFLIAEGEYNESFWGTKIKIRGTIRNSANVADYKDVTVQVTYFSKTKSVLATKEYTLYEVYPPNTRTPFRLDIANYENVNAISWEVIKALPN